jgi:hypothetical protein
MLRPFPFILVFRGVTFIIPFLFKIIVYGRVSFSDGLFSADQIKSQTVDTVDLEEEEEEEELTLLSLFHKERQAYGITISVCIFATLFLKRSRGSSVSIGYGLDDRVSIPNRFDDGISSLRHNVQTGSGAHPASYPMDIECS